ncbi:MAG: hypothetical protein LBU22_03310 [Dysgonamonadaceae bacterium]|jgi:hypothetical protein|nr:hypothetical protein [Dysgonamonadaceae bacterium]
MDKFYLPITIRPDNSKHWRIHYACLKADNAQDNNAGVTRNYIIECKPNQQNLQLFSIRIDSYFLISEEKEELNIKLSDLSFNLNFDSKGNTLSLLMTDKNEQQDDPVKVEQYTMKVYDEEIVVYQNDVRYQGILNVNIKLGPNEKCYYDTFSLTFIEAAHIYYGAVDFGSESSQIKYINADTINPLYAKKIDIIEKLKDELKNTSSEFWQEDTSKKKDLYRSVFPISPILSHDHQDKTKIFSTAEFNEDIHLLEGTETTNAEGYLLPNLKLYKLHNNDFHSWRINDNISLSRKGGGTVHLERIFENIRKQLTMTLVRTLLSSILEVDHSNAKTIGINLRLLAPNIYRHEEIFDMIEYTYRHFNQIKEQVLSKDRQLDIAVEVSVIAESEAAIIKEIKLDRNNHFGGKMVLTIDGGKGTMDIGVCFVKEGNDKHIFSLYRSGFAGAGDLITYAFFDYFINRLNKSLSKESLMNEIDKLVQVVVSKFANEHYLKDQYEKIREQESSPRLKIKCIREFILLIPDDKSDNEKQLLKSYCDAWDASSINITTIKEHIRGLKYQQRLHLINFFDEMKKNSSIEEKAILENSFYWKAYNLLKSENLDGFIGLLNANKHASMFFCNEYKHLPEEIKKRIDNITASVLFKLTSADFWNPEHPKNKIDIAVYSGRCFLYVPLKNRLEECLREKIIDFELEIEKRSVKNKLRNVWGSRKRNETAAHEAAILKEEIRKTVHFSFYPISMENGDTNYFKYASIIGAIIKDAGVNNGSELSGILFSNTIISDIKNNMDKYERKLFYEGHQFITESTRDNSSAIRFNGYEMPDEINREYGAKGYFVGKGFLIQYRDKRNEGQVKFAEFDPWKQDTNRLLSNMLYESFFPFNI